MKTIQLFKLLSIIFILTGSCQFLKGSTIKSTIQDKTLTINLEVLDLNEDSIFYTNEILQSYDNFKKISANKYVADIPIKDGPQIVFIYASTGVIPIYVDKEQTLSVVTNFNNNTQIEGPNGLDAEVFIALYKTLSSRITTLTANGPIEQFQNTLKNIFDEADDIIEQNRNKTSKSFLEYSTKFLKFQRLEYMISLAFWYRRDHPDFDITTMPQEFIDLQDKLDFDDSLKDEAFYKSYLFAAIPEYLVDLKSITDKRDYNSTLSRKEQSLLKYNLVKEILRGEPMTQNLLIIAESYLNEADVTESENFIKQIQEDTLTYFRHEEFDKLKKIVQDKIKLEAGEIPHFKLTGLDGKEYHFKDFAGKVVYLDFWASWCGPCRAEMQFAAPKLHNDYQDKNVVFIYINLDRNIEDAIKAIKDDNIAGLHIIGGKHGADNEIMKAFQVTGIPHYVLINKNGGIYKTNAPRPSSEEIRIDIDKLLQE